MRELLARVDSAELTEWQAEYKISPWGEARGDLQAGIVAAMVGNVNLEKGGTPFSPNDFALEFGGETEPKTATAEEMAAKLKVFTMSRGGEVKGE